MYLKRLEIQGFKSFAKKTLLEFDRGITAVVGPNGSGKSNIADSLRWVLGEQSAKMMRGKKSDDVIFAGSDQRGRAGLAEVFATFDNRDKKIPVDSSEVSIGRRVDRSGESEYLINGNKVRLLDIVDLVLKSNIGTSRYTVIGQGTIDQFILQGPSGVKELIDEASGVKTYYMRREKTLRRMEQTAQNLMRAEDLIAEIEPRLKSLRRLAKRMEEREKLETELKILLIEYFSGRYGVISKEVERIQDGLGRAEEARKKQEALIENALSETLQKDSQKTQELNEVAGWQEKLARLQHEKNKILEHLSLLKGRLESMKGGSVSDPATIRANLHSLFGKIQENEKSLAGIDSEETGVKASLNDATEKLSGINKKLDEVYKQLSEPHEIDAEKLTHELIELEDEFSQFFVLIENAKHLDEVRSGASDIKVKLNSFKNIAEVELANPQQNVNSLKSMLKVFLDEKEQIQGLISSISVEVSKIQVARDFIAKQLEAHLTDKRRLELELAQSSSSGTDFVAQIADEEMRLKVELSELEEKIHKIQNGLQGFYEQEKLERERNQEFDRMVRDKQSELSKMRDIESAWQIEKAKLETNYENLEREVVQALGEKGMDEIKHFKGERSETGLGHKIEKIKHQLDMLGGVDELTMKEHSETEMRYEHLTGQVFDLKKALQDLKLVMDELDEHIASSFNQAFHKINEKFEYYFKILFNGGRAYLAVVKNLDKTEESEAEKADSADESKDQLRPEEKLVKKYEQGGNNIVGIDIKATPPGKKLTSIQALSGGERALTSIALLCSMLSSFPSPFVMLDEVDAALDEANTMRFGQILGTLAHQTQFITITHNRETMTQANTIYGVTMGDDSVSKLLSIKFDQAQAYAK